MSEQSFSLKPFSSDVPPPSIAINGTIERSAPLITVRYALVGHLPDIAFPHPADTPSRKDRLWEETCFELFLAVKNATEYWEFNLSPAGHWNVYHFTEYRHGMREETVLSSLPFQVRNGPEYFMLAVEFDVEKIVPSGRSLEVGITAVIKQKGGRITYWALTHSAPQPDFHRRDSFIIGL